LSQLAHLGGVLKAAVSRIDAVCNGVVQFRGFTKTDDHGVPHFDGPVGWASRCDMLVVSVLKK
jgi:hypothetical protein